MTYWAILCHMAIPLLDKPTDNTGPQIRVLYCQDCKTLDELPMYSGKPENDTLLQITIERHTSPTGTTHIGTLFVLPVAHWERTEVRKQIIEQIKGGGSAGLDEMSEGFYDSRSTFGEDAMKCYQAHGRPVAGCQDYKNDSKKLLPNTNADRKDLGLAPVAKSPVHIFLCSFCPYHAVVTQRQRDAAGMYN